MARGIFRKFNKGEKIYRLTVLGNSRYENGVMLEECLCECGNKVWIRHKSLLANKTKSCGCLQKEKATYTCVNLLKKHGLRYTRIYKIYYGLLNRCNNKKAKDYMRYGGRGIKCLWRNFEDFYKDMGESYENHVKEFGERNTTIDRINVNGDYSKENCRWATMLEQQNNRSGNHDITYKGKRYKTISSLCRDLGLNYQGVRKRILVGWDIVDAIEKPFRS